MHTYMYTYVCTHMFSYKFLCPFSHSYEHNTYILLHLNSFLAALSSLWDFSSPTRDGTCTLEVEVQSPNCWTTKEVPRHFFINTTV